MHILKVSPGPMYAPAYRQRPASDQAGLLAFEADGTPCVYIRREAVDRVVEHCHRHGPNEAIGFLAGRVFQDDDGYWTLVETALCCDHARRSPSSVETTEQDQDELDQWRRDAGLVYDRLGWWHSHYELRLASYSSVDRRNQDLWCPSDWQVGLLVIVDDGIARLRFYRGPKSEPLTPLRRADGAPEPKPPKRLRVASHRITESTMELAPAGSASPSPPRFPKHVAAKHRHVAMLLRKRREIALIAVVGAAVLVAAATFVSFPASDGDDRASTSNPSEAQHEEP